MPELPSPTFLVDLAQVRANCEILAEIREQAGCRIVHALKAFSLPQAFPTMRPHLDGCCASGPWEARLAHEEFGGAVLTCAPAYTEADLRELLEISTHLDFNSPGQWHAFRDQVVAHPRFQSGELRCGLRINPQCSTGATPLYDPCGPGSRLGTPPDLLPEADLRGITGLHFHTLCEQPFRDLERTMDSVEAHFGGLLRSTDITSLNLGGGHWITKPDYDRNGLINFLQQVREKFALAEVWLEPGEAAVLNSGILIATVLDTFRNGDTEVAILDASATAHLPDVLEMPYRPEVTLADGSRGEPAGAQNFTCRLGGSTCLAGDVFGDYSFRKKLTPGTRLHFLDMAQYTMVKTSFFNGIRHPALAIQHEEGRTEVVREFDYPDYRSRIG